MNIYANAYLEKYTGKMRPIDKIIIHCSATKEGRDYRVEDIDKWHRHRGFAEIGYHYVIYRNGHIALGRHITRPGAHCNGQNARSIGICYIGGLTEDGSAPKDTRTPEQRESLRGLVEALKAKYPGSTVHGHNEFSNKACPCFNVQTDL